LRRRVEERRRHHGRCRRARGGGDIGHGRARRGCLCTAQDMVDAKRGLAVTERDRWRWPARRCETTAVARLRQRAATQWEGEGAHRGHHHEPLSDAEHVAVLTKREQQ
jgi:hypothetical protein